MNSKNPHFTYLRGTQEICLAKENVDLNKNDEQIEKVFKKYSLNRHISLVE